MSPSDQDLFDMSNIVDSFDAWSESVEEHFESVARSLKETLRTTPWIPDYMKSTPAPPARLSKPIRPPVGYIGASRRWISENRAVTAALIAFIGTGAFIVWRRRRSDKAKRRAKRTKHGARTEVVILSGSPHSPLTKSVSCELERRGFIIYIPVSSVTEEQVIQGESGGDIRPLNMDIASPASTEEAIEKVTNLLHSPYRAHTHHPAYKLNLAAFILLPPLNHPVGAVTQVSSPDWSDVFNNNLLAPFTLIQAFLPLLTAYRSNLLFLTSSIHPSLASPSHAPENVVTGAVERYISTLRNELPSINVVQLKLGHLDFGQMSKEKNQLVLAQGLSRADLTRTRLGESIVKGSPLRELHNAIFDAVVRGKGKGTTLFVGRGSRLYYVVGNWAPAGIVGWMMGSSRHKPPAFARARPDESAEANVEWEIQ